MSSSTVENIYLVVQQYALYITYIIFGIGMIGNFLIILVFSTLKIFRNNPCVFYFTIEAIANIFQLIDWFLIRFLASTNGTDPANSILFWCKFRSIIIIPCTLIAFSAISFSACDQYLSTNHQVYLRQMSTIKLARRLMFPAIGISLLHTIPFAIFLDIRASVCSVFNPTMAQYISYFYYPILSGALPISVASVSSILAYRNVRRIIRRQMAIVRRRLDRQLTAMVLIRVIIFVILTLPYAIQRMYFFIVKPSPSDVLLYTISNLVLTFSTILFNMNYAISFYIFITSSTRFRRQVKYVLMKKYWRRLKRLCCFCGENEVHPAVEMRSVGSNSELE